MSEQIHHSKCWQAQAWDVDRYNVLMKELQVLKYRELMQTLTDADADRLAEVKALLDEHERARRQTGARDE